ncbi:APC family permease [Demequina salsinemoris]|uniref:APC family permease n=1 Tax=Demequina salsinemoris TaxID=577470 RepID=UPI00078487FD|nr:APC family permease [Demequina salsinemoris]
MAPKEKYSQELSRSLTIKENMLITLSSVTPASSVFIIVPALVVALAGASVAAMAIGAFIALFVGWCYAELASRYPITGGEYTWAARLLGRGYGFGVFLLSLVSGVLIIAVIASGVGPYLSVVWEGFNSSITTVVVVAITTLIAALTITTNAWVTGVCLALEVLALIVLAVMGFSHVSRGVDTFVMPQTLGADGGLETVTWAILFSLVPVALFAFNGYGGAVYYAEETKGASKTIGKAIMISLLITVIAEIVPLAAVILGSSDLEALVSSESPMNWFLLDRGNEAINVIVSLGIAVAVFNAVIAVQIQLARLLFSSARDRSWPDAIDRVLGSVHPRTKTPIVATIVIGLAGIGVGFLPFDWLLIATGASAVVIYSTVAVAALRVRGAAGREGGYRMPLFPLPPIVVLAIMAYVTYQIIASDPTPLLVSVVAIVLGVLWYALFIHPQRGERWTLPDPQDDAEHALADDVDPDEVEAAKV